MLGGLNVLALVIINVLKRRFRMIALAVGLLPVVLLGLLLVNEGDYAENSPDWLLAVTALTPLVALYAALIVPALRLAKPASWWARRFYDEEKVALANERFGRKSKPVV